MKITNVSVNLVAIEGQMVKGYASVLIDNCFVIRDIRIIKRDNGYLVAMPSKKTSDGNYVDMAHPINSETRKMFEERILGKFFEEVSSQLKNIKVQENYELRFNTEDIHNIALVDLSQNKVISTYLLEDYKTETLQELEEEINETFGGPNE